MHLRFGNLYCFYPHRYFLETVQPVPENTIAGITFKIIEPNGGYLSECAQTIPSFSLSLVYRLPTENGASKGTRKQFVVQQVQEFRTKPTCSSASLEVTSLKSVGM